MTDLTQQEIRILRGAGFEIDPKTGMFTHTDIDIGTEVHRQAEHLMRDSTGHLGNRRERRAAAAQHRKKRK